MLPRKRRLPLRNREKRAPEDKGGDPIQTQTLGVVVGRKRKGSVSRFAAIVSGKVAKKATDRNRIRRRIRSAIKKTIGEMDEGYDVLLLAKKPSTKASQRQLEEDLKGALRKAGALQRK